MARPVVDDAFALDDQTLELPGDIDPTRAAPALVFSDQLLFEADDLPMEALAGAGVLLQLAGHLRWELATNVLGLDDADIDDASFSGPSIDLVVEGIVDRPEILLGEHRRGEVLIEAPGRHQQPVGPHHVPDVREDLDVVIVPIEVQREGGATEADLPLHIDAELEVIKDVPTDHVAV